MNRCDWLITTTLLRAIGLVLLIVTGATLLAGFVDEAGARNDNYTSLDVLRTVLLNTPEQVLGVLSLVVLIGALMGLSSLAATSELTVMRASGMSLGRLFVATSIPVLLVLAVAVPTGEFITPRLAELAETGKQVAIADGEMLWLPGGRWHRENDLFVHARALGANGELYGVSVFKRQSDGSLQNIIYAHRATPGSNGYWSLDRVRATSFGRERTEQPTTGHPDFARIAMSTTILSPRLMLEPARLSLHELRQVISFRHDQALATVDYELALWSRILQVPAALAATLVAMGLVVGSTRTLSAAARLALAVSCGVVLRYLMDLAVPVSLVYGISPAVAVSTPPLLVALLGLVLLRER